MKSLPRGNVAQQTERVLENLKAILTHAGLTLTHVVKIKMFLKRELPGKRNVLEYRPAPAAKRDVWITARPHEPVLAK
jgi:enamine deaminase RidA (YjgF/YER057c/UK114 family)